MRDVLRGQFGYGKYHFTEYKFCKGWFGKKFSDEIELQTVEPNDLVEIDALNSEELSNFNLEPEYENMDEDAANAMMRTRDKNIRNYFDSQKNNENESENE